MISRDINMRVICDSLGLPTEDYISNQAVDDSDNIFTGFSSYLVDDQLIDRFYNGEEIILDLETTQYRPNQFLMLVSSSNEKKTAIARYVSPTMPLKPLNKYKKGVWGIKPRN